MNASPRLPAPVSGAGSLRVLACSLAIAMAAHPQLTQATPLNRGVSNIVLVHGAFTDGSIWSEVVGILQSHGYHVSVVQNSLKSLADDVAATRRILERLSGDVVLVGHSWGGVVITEAGNTPAVKGLVYVSALVPDDGESTREMLNRLHASMDIIMKPDASGLVWLDDPNTFRDVMADDVSPAIVQRLASTQQPIAAAAFDEKVSRAAWHDRPAWYLITENDRALKPTVQHALAAQISARTVSLHSSHLSLIAYPEVAAGLIERAAVESTSNRS